MECIGFELSTIQDKEQLLRLCKQLGSISIEEVAPILEIDENELEQLLDSMSELSKVGRVYKYVEPNENKKELPLFFQYHSEQEIDLITRCFLAEVEVAKVIRILSPREQVINNFYGYFRKLIYEKQIERLSKLLEKQFKIPQERTYMDKVFYLYLYGDELFVSDKNLKSQKVTPHSEEERLKIKNIYFRLRRKKFSISYKKYYHHHYAEEIWRQDKTFDELEFELKKLLFC